MHCTALYLLMSSAAEYLSRTWIRLVTSVGQPGITLPVPAQVSHGTRTACLPTQQGSVHVLNSDGNVTVGVPSWEASQHISIQHVTTSLSYSKVPRACSHNLSQDSHCRVHSLDRHARSDGSRITRSAAGDCVTSANTVHPRSMRGGQHKHALRGVALGTVKVAGAGGASMHVLHPVLVDVSVNKCSELLAECHCCQHNNWSRLQCCE